MSTPNRAIPATIKKAPTPLPAVTVKNESGTLIGSSNLESGKILGDSASCVFPFEIKDVKDAGFFQVEVGRRGGLSYSKEELEDEDWTVHASLGP